MPKKVMLMLSGGVDSSVAAAKLVEQGYDVTGVYMKCWSLEQLDILGMDNKLYACSWEDDLEDAKNVAKKLNIPFLVWDFQTEYRNKVVEYMLNEYAQGRTPNPDVMCNSAIKFGIFYEKAINEEKADFVSTGHYARIKDGFVVRSKDIKKDQSYFLWRIKKHQIPYILFPIGEFETKAEVRQYAEEKGLITARKKDSQGLCFVGKTPLREMLLEKFGKKEGYIVKHIDYTTTKKAKIMEVEDQKVEVVGKHPGSFLYTIGQREKLGLSGGPWFVSKIDIVNNLVYVTHGSFTKALFHKNLQISSCNSFVDNISDYPDIKAQIRYHQLANACKIVSGKDCPWDVEFLQEVKSPAVGQSIVFYSDNKLLAGGVIDQIKDD